MNPSLILKLGLFLVPVWYFFPSITVESLPRHGQFVMMMAVSTVALAFVSKNLWVRLFCIYSVAWVLFAQVISMIFVSPHNIIGATMARDFMRHLLVAVGIYAIVVRSEDSLDSWLDWICALACFQMIVGIPQVFGYFPETELLKSMGLMAEGKMNESATGLMENRNFFSGFLAISLPFFLRGRWKWWLPLLIGHLALSQTSTSVAAAAVGAFIALHGQWLILAVVWASGAAYLWIDGDALRSERWNYWREMVTGFDWDSWFSVTFGYGPYARWMHKFHPHSEYMKLWWDFGPPGVVLAAGYLWTLPRGDRTLWAALLAGAVICFGSFPFHLPVSAYLLIIIMALIEREGAK